MIKIGINGFGRIGRLAFRSIMNRKNVTVVAINDLLDVDYLAYLLKYDSVHGRFDGDVTVKEGNLIVNGNTIRITAERNPEEINWGALDIDFVLEATGLFTKKDQANKHIIAGAKKVIISAPSKDAPMFVMGVNHTDIAAETTIFSNASCTTNCLAPVAKLLHDNFGIVEGFMTTVHAATASQNTVDAPLGNRRRGRSALNNIIPTSTGATKAVTKVIPELEGKLIGMAFRIPSPDVSVIDFSVRLEKPTTYAEIMQVMKSASEKEMKGILGYTEDEVVSQDFLSEPRTSVIDAGAGLELNPNFFKIISWYDNEFGYATKIVDLLEYAYSVS